MNFFPIDENIGGVSVIQMLGGGRQQPLIIASEEGEIVEEFSTVCGEVTLIIGEYQLTSVRKPKSFVGFARGSRAPAPSSMGCKKGRGGEGRI